MKVVGLTGGIATGKTTVSKMLAEKGFKIIDADEIARTVVEQGKPAYLDIVERFGKAVVAKDGNLDRKKLAALVFSDLESLESLNLIVHPRVRQEVDALLESYRSSGEGVVFFDCPLLFESHMEASVDEIWVVYADRVTQIQRMMERNHFTEMDADLRIKAQMSIEEKRDRADHVIDNRDTLQALACAVDHMLDMKGIV